MADIDIGSISPLTQFQAGNNYWARTMNLNLIKMSMMIAPSVISAVEELPGAASEGDMYLSGSRICMWIDEWDSGEGIPEPAGWRSAAPVVGTQLLIRDINEIWLYDETNEWVVMTRLDDPYIPVQRTLAFYAPGFVRPGSIMFKYVAAMPLAIPAGAPGSGAGLEVAPGDNITFTITAAGVPVGTIDFANGSTEGVFDFDNNVVIHNGLPEENKYIQAQELVIHAPADPKGASGMNVTIRAEIWEKD